MPPPTGCTHLDASNLAVGAVLQQQINSVCGAQFHISCKSCVQQRGGIAHLTGNYWPSTSPSAISATLWKVTSSMFLPTTNHSLLLFPPSPETFHPNGRGTWSSSPSLPQTSGTSKGLPTLRQMHSPSWMWVPCMRHPLPLTTRLYGQSSID